MARIRLLLVCLVAMMLLGAVGSASAARRQAGTPLPLVAKVAAQPLGAQVQRLIEALEALGSPLPAKTKAALQKAAQETDDGKVTQEVQAALDPLCLLAVQINPESRVKVQQGPAKPLLLEQGWRAFLVKVQNQAGTTARLQVQSPNAQPLFNSPQNEVRNRWLDMQTFDQQPLQPRLSGLELEYRILLLYSRDAGKREAKLSMNVGQGTQDLGFRGEADILFTCQPSADLTFRVQDEKGQPTTAMFTIRDRQGRIYPAQTRRLAPDFAFQPQIYRANGEKLRLPQGIYTLGVARGPEYLTQTRTLTMTGKPQTVTIQLKRWIDPAAFGWWSGDHHIHAAGCAHYTNPTEGVFAADMIRHCLGEDLKVGCNLTWGPCFDFQKQFFTGKDDKVSQYPYLLRYDIEVSGFGSHQSGHLCLLRLKDQMYPGGTSKDHWPTLCLNTLRWAKKQGAVCGPAHSANGIISRSTELPNYVVPPYDGIGADEYIVDVTHNVPGPDGNLVPAVDFLSTVDTGYVWELNMWYQTLNVGFRTRISGETDFPCITGERVGVGRSYVKLDGRLDYDTWCENIRQGRNYVSDGKSHLMDFKVNETAVGEKGSELRLTEPGKVHVRANVAALLDETPNPQIKNRPLTQYPLWHLERARIEGTRSVPVEVIVNGYSVAQRAIVADGKLQEVAFDVPITQSSWVAMRILGSSHTNPVFVLVGAKPIRASKRSAEWCLKGVDQCWSQKQRFIRPEEMEDARQAYEYARVAYRRILSECETD